MQGLFSNYILKEPLSDFVPKNKIPSQFTVIVDTLSEQIST